MHSGKRFSPIEFIMWTRRSLYILFILSAVPTVIYYLGFTFISFLGNRLRSWERRLLSLSVSKTMRATADFGKRGRFYGAIINDSRSFGYILRDSLSEKNSGKVKMMFKRHYAWLTALRFQLRESRNWENMSTKQFKEYAEKYDIPERLSTLDADLKNYLSAEELQYILSKKNRATQLMALQSKDLSEAYAKGEINDFQWSQINQQLVKFTDNQGKAERIKNFPYPRNFSSITTYLLMLFIIFVPFGLIKEFDKMGEGTLLANYTLWFNIPFSLLVTWCFHTLDSVGEASVNPLKEVPMMFPLRRLAVL